MKKLLAQFILFSSLSTIAYTDNLKFNTTNYKLDLDNVIFHSPKDELLLTEIIDILEKKHFIKRPYRDLRLNSLQLFIERLDPSNSIFLEEEINNSVNIMTDTVSMHEAINSSDHLTGIVKKDLEMAYQLFHIYKTRYLDRYTVQTNFLGGLDENNILSSKQILRDRSEAKRPSNKLSLEDLWKNLVINDVIQLVLSGNNLAEAKEKLLKRINNQLNFFKQTGAEDIFNIYANSVTGSYGPHTNYMSPRSTEDFDMKMSLSLEGIGALLSSDGMYTSILSLIAGGPAEKGDSLKPNDKIIGVAQENESQMTDVVGWRIDDVVKLIRGPKGSRVRLEVIPGTSLDDSNTTEIEIVRNIVKLEDQAAEKEIISISRPSGQYKIGVIALPAFYFDYEAYQKRDANYRSSSKDVKKLLQELKREDVDGLIIDLRNNGGGSLYEANALAHLLIGRGTTVQIKNSDGNISSLGEAWGHQFFDAPLAVLVNKFSASASEILAGVVQDYNRGIIVGTETFGKGTVQRVDPLSIGQIKVTESKFYRVSGSSTQNQGVLPDINLPSAIDLEEFGEDKLPNALVHDNIPAINFRNFGSTDFMTEDLRILNNKRVSSSPFYKNLKRKKTWRGEQSNNWLDLNIDKRSKQKKKAEEELLSIENSLRSELGLTIYLSYQDFLEREDDPDTLNIDKKEVEETANIIIDMLEILNRPLVASLKTG